MFLPLFFFCVLLSPLVVVSLPTHHLLLLLLLSSISEPLCCALKCLLVRFFPFLYFVSVVSVQQGDSGLILFSFLVLLQHVPWLALRVDVSKLDCLTFVRASCLSLSLSPPHLSFFYLPSLSIFHSMVLLLSLSFPLFIFSLPRLVGVTDSL